MLCFFCQITIKEYQCPQGVSGCENKNHSIIDVIAESDDNRSVIHYLWSVIGSPTIIAAYFEQTDVDLKVNWTEILNEDSKEGIHFSEKSKYITAFVIPAIYEFQDPKDELFYTEPHVQGITKHLFQTKNISWQSPEVDHKHNMTTFKASMLGGSVIFQVSWSLNFPSLLYMTQVHSCRPQTSMIIYPQGAEESYLTVFPVKFTVQL